MGQEDPLEKGMATHSSILAWRIPWTEEPGGLQSIGPQRVRQDLVTEFYGQLYLEFKVLLPIKLDIIMVQNDLIMCTFGNLCNPMDCSLPGTSVHGDSSGRNT